MLEGLTPPSKTRGSCKVAMVTATLAEADKKILLEAIANTTAWPIKSLARALNERGLQISESPLSNHRAKSCVCFR
jgi:hypothetical protein